MCRELILYGGPVLPLFRGKENPFPAILLKLRIGYGSGIQEITCHLWRTVTSVCLRETVETFDRN